MMALSEATNKSIKFLLRGVRLTRNRLC